MKRKLKRIYLITNGVIVVSIIKTFRIIKKKIQNIDRARLELFLLIILFYDGNITW